jgi:hypothetical protein
VLVGRPVGVGVAVGELLADGDGLGDTEPDGVDGSTLGVAGDVAVEEGRGEVDGTGVPVAEAGCLVSDAVTSTGAAGGGAAASAIPAAIAAIPPMAPAPSKTGVQEEALFAPDPGPSTVTGCLPVVRPRHPRVPGTDRIGAGRHGQVGGRGSAGPVSQRLPALRLPPRSRSHRSVRPDHGRTPTSNPVA